MPEITENTPVEQRDVAEVAKPTANLDLLSQVKWTADNVNKIETAPVVEEVKPVETATNLETANQDLNIEKPAEEVKAEETKPEETVEEAPLTLEGDALTLDENTEEGWKAVAKLEELELENDSYEEFKTKFEEKVAAPLKAEIEALRAVSEDKIFEGVDPRVRLEFELAKSGLSYEQIQAPLKNIEAFKAMNTAELVRADIEARYPNAESTWVDAEVEKQIESGNAAHEETRIRLELDAIENQIITERESKIQEYKANSEKLNAERRNSEIENISKALNEVPSFMGSNIAPEAKQIMAKNYAEGKYDTALKDPNFIAAALLYKEFGEKAFQAAIAKSEAKGKMAITNKLHNTPPLDNIGGGAVVQNETLTGFDKLKNDPRFKTN
jgi:hypothetical protein